MTPLLNLTQYERRWNDYYTSGAKRGVILRRYPATVTLSAQQQRQTVSHQVPRRSRVYSITWTGDVFALKVSLVLSTGEKLTVDPVHIPLLSGHDTASTRSLHPVLKPAWPARTPVILTAPQSAAAWVWVIEPNVVLPGNAQLLCEYTLENTSSNAVFPPAPYNFYRVQQCIHQWEFPGFEGGV